MRLVNFLYGKKTYIIAVILAVLNLLVACDVFTPDQIEQINLILVALGLGALRAGVAKL